MSKATKLVSAMLVIVLPHVPLASPTAGAAATESICTAKKAWFPNTPIPANTRPNIDSDCEFYQWAWQTFLFVTQPDAQATDSPRFMKFEGPSELLDQDTPGMTFTSANIPIMLDSVVQAGSLSVLVAQNRRAIYYRTHLNVEFVQFVKANAYLDHSILINASPDQQFPRGVLALKSAWKIVGPGEDISKFFTARARIPLLAIKNNKVAITSSKTREETVALLGLHIAGVVEGHPEFIWATFEHNDNAPDLPTGVHAQSDVAVDSQRDWTLYRRGTMARRCNQKAGQAPMSSLSFVDHRRQTLQPTISVFREFPFGGDDDPDVIKLLNDSVHAGLPSSLSVWKNYSLIGALWLNVPDRDFKPNVDFKQIDAADPTKRILGGDKKLSNTTMETFTQSTQNCLSCHNTRAQVVEGVADTFPPKRLNVSHFVIAAFGSSKKRAQQKAVADAVRVRRTRSFLTR